MTLHRLASVTIGVPNVDETARYYTDFGLTRSAATGSPPPTAVSSCAWWRPPPAGSSP